MPKCEKTDSDEESMSKLVRTQTSIDGKCGLRNLGNTCFMNSGVQCLSNTPELCEYILNDTYKADINIDNPLGTKGELVSKFAHLLKRLWYQDKSSHPPFSFKRAIGKF
jgi:ubiquitin carboxyl-terminal hydrolase 4/11